MPQPEPPVAELSRLVREAQSGERIPSLSAAAVGNGEVVWQEALGLARIEEKEAATPDTQYRVGSITKTFTAAAIMQLRDAGELDLDDRLERHVPEAHHGGPTIRRMLAHMSGLQRELPGYVWETLEFPDREGLVSGLADARQVLPPGARWHYSNLAFALLGEVVARRSGLDYEDYVRERLLEPLGLRRTTFDQHLPAANAYYVEPYADVVRPEQNLIKGAFAAAGSLWSTTADLARWGVFLVEGAEGVLRKEAAQEMRRFQSMADLEKWKLGWGLGLMLMREDDRLFIGHGGAMPGFLAGLAISPDGRSGAVVLVNSGAGVKIDELTRKLAVKAAEAYPPEPEPWHPVEDVPAELEPLLGRWWSEGSEIVIRYRNGKLEARPAEAAPADPPAVFEPDGSDRFRGVSGPEEGEALEVVRGEDGTIEKLYWATYPMTRTPQSFSR
ncbi:MAG TPA: serine hydrolase domain-containing protein [Gaiellaceae bacterium]|nr:serine hydrolase domain-containing protein [Gaiellaceae bacterium]